MKNIIRTVICSVVVTALIVICLLCGVGLTDLQANALTAVCITAAVSAVYCFAAGELSGNNSQMDKLWSVLPIIYAWTVTAMGGFSVRLVIMAVLITLWGCRLTYNFAKKGAYSLKFWAGEEDYRWKMLRSTKVFGNKALWALFDLLFISVYQNALVAAICFPMIAVMEAESKLGAPDIAAALLTLFFICYETVADVQQMKFQTCKWDMIHSGKRLEELEEPYSKGFNTTGLWSLSRHPNYLGEQMIWICLYLFVIGAGTAKYGVFHWTAVGPLLLVLLFMGSSTLAEAISAKKYPEYNKYKESVCKYLPLKKYK